MFNFFLIKIIGIFNKYTRKLKNALIKYNFIFKTKTTKNIQGRKVS